MILSLTLFVRKSARAHSGLQWCRHALSRKGRGRNKTHRDTRLEARPFVGIVIKFADDAGRSRLGLLQIIAAVAVAAEPSRLAQFVERASDLAAVLTANAFDDVRIEHRRRGQRLLDV